jgi:uncharacterized protein
MDDWRAQGIIDCDTHPTLRNGTQSLLPYVTAAWRDRLGSQDMGIGKVSGPRYTNPNPTYRRDATPPDGGPPASDPEFVRQQLLEPYGVGAALLICFQAGGLNSWTDAGEATEWARAFNQYFIENWLPVDPRFRLAMIVAPQNPDAAVAEIRRIGDHPAVAGVWLPMLNILLGNRYYYPIYAAATEMGLPILLHTAGAEGTFQGAPTWAVASPSTFAEKIASLGTGGIAINNLSSLVFEGVFEAFPSLRVVWIEAGWTWVGPAMWQMDRSWRALRRQVPWVKRAPSEYVIENCRFTSEAVDEPEPRDLLLQAAEMMHGERTLMFSSDYPHWDGDSADLVFKGFGDDLRRRIFVDNALDTFGSRMALARRPATTEVGT